MDSSAADGTDTTTARRVLPGIVGGSLAVVMLAAMTYMPVAHLALLIGVVAVVIVALSWRGTARIRVVRWWARTTGVIAAAAMAMIVFGDVFGGHGPPLTTVTGVAIVSLWMAVFLGIAAAFFWEGAAGLVLDRRPGVRSIECSARRSISYGRLGGSPPPVRPTPPVPRRGRAPPSAAVRRRGPDLAPRRPPTTPGGAL